MKNHRCIPINWTILNSFTKLLIPLHRSATPFIEWHMLISYLFIIRKRTRNLYKFNYSNWHITYFDQIRHSFHAYFRSFMTQIDVIHHSNRCCIEIRCDSWHSWKICINWRFSSRFFIFDFVEIGLINQPPTTPHHPKKNVLYKLYYEITESITYASHTDTFCNYINHIWDAFYLFIKYLQNNNNIPMMNILRLVRCISMQNLWLKTISRLKSFTLFHNL